MNVPIAEAKANLSELIRRAEAGEEITITRHGKPVARLSAPKREKVPFSELRGIGKGKIWMAEDFDEYIPEGFEDYI